MEAQIFYALALIATAPPSDKTHAKQKQATAILEPLYRLHPQHPGLAHYLIHASDSTELAPQGLAAAREYSKIAPSAPHALHMPSHIFTRLGLWDDSIASNRAARAAAHEQGDIGEELHAMDYLTYAYLQRGREADAQQSCRRAAIDDRHLRVPVQRGIRRHGDAGAPRSRATRLGQRRLIGAVAEVRAPRRRARLLGESARPHAGRAMPAHRMRISKAWRNAGVNCRSAGNAYWATQVDVLLKEAQAWRSAAKGESEAAIRGLRAAADEEDALEKLPVTPGPVVPAREQLGELLLNLKRPQEALQEFRTALVSAPRRRGALVGAIAAAEKVGDKRGAAEFGAELN